MAKQPKSLNKILATSAGAAVVAGALAPAAVSAAAADDFTDVSEDTRHYDEINELYNLGVVSGYDDGSFGPDEFLKRSEAAEMIFTAGEFVADEERDYMFTDVPPRIGAVVDALYEEGVVSGFSETQFGPDAMLQREEMAKIIVEAFDFEVDGAAESDFSDRGQTTLYPYIDVVAELDIADGYENGDFGVGDNILRKDFAKMLYNAWLVWQDNQGEEVTVASAGGNVEEVITGVYAVNLPLDSEQATADSEVQIQVGEEVFDLTYDEDAEAFRNLQISGYTKEEIEGASIWVDGEQLGSTDNQGGEQDTWMDLSTLSSYDDYQVTQIITGVYGVEVDLSGEADVTADSEVALKVGEDVIELTDEDGDGSYRNLQVSGFEPADLEAGTVVVSN